MLLTFFLAVALQQAASQKPAYRLSCDSHGQSTDCSVCMACGGADVDHFEIRDDSGKVQFQADSSPGEPVADVAMEAFSYADRAIEEVVTTQGAPAQPRRFRVTYVFESTSSGLVPFNPPVATPCLGNAFLASGIALSCDFDAGFFRFEVLLAISFDRHRIELMPNQEAFPAFPALGRRSSQRLSVSADLPMYLRHEKKAPQSIVKIEAGQVRSFFQSSSTGLKDAANQVVVISAWAPVSMKPASTSPPVPETAIYDPNNVWLQVRVNGRTGWIHGLNSFHAIGLR